jgi:glycine cleavage system P protein (glycine dehydrogenase)
MSMKSKQNAFVNRHIGPRDTEIKEMLKTIHVSDMATLINQTIPDNILLSEKMVLPDTISEAEYLKTAKELASKNKLFRSYIGLGYYGTITPSPILRNIFENPGWYTQYTPYQAEIAQGRLEALLNFQTVVSDLTGFEIANASLLDEGTAAAEAMSMVYHKVNKNPKKEIKARFFVSEKCLPQTIDVLMTRARPFPIELVIGNHEQIEITNDFFGALLQYPAEDGELFDYSAFISKCKDKGVYTILAADILSLALLKSPAELGVDIAVGNTQRFGVPMGFGGPHAAYFACHDEFKRLIPGRIIGVSIDTENNPAYRMALQTREQHIRREKATSNICTAQALLAIMAGMYAVYHGAEGIREIAGIIHHYTCLLNDRLNKAGYEQTNSYFFDTLRIANPGNTNEIRKTAESKAINFRYFENGDIGISLDETVTQNDLNDILSLFGIDPVKGDLETKGLHIPESLRRESSYLTHPVFNTYRSETELMRYIKRLENGDLSLTHSMISLGSCTMKLNAATELFPVSWPEFSSIHPFVPKAQVTGYLQMIDELENYLCKITGFDACSLQPNSGAQGEFAGLSVISAYHIDNGDQQRNITLIPSSAHGTNPASAVMAGMQVVVVECDEKGNIRVDDLKAKAEQYEDKLAALMVTYPSTHGVFEKAIVEICEIVHQNGGLVYMDGANMNAQVGFTNPANIGADVCHLNLHKTFAIPHGGGGPGVGPICVNNKLAAYLPGHSLVNTGGEKAINAISSAPYGSANVVLISYAYIKMLGTDGLRKATEIAILNANYLMKKLESHYPILYVGEKGRVAHEFIVDFRQFKHDLGIEVEDIAKRLIDYGFHAPTVSFPVAGTLMIEPTESESKQELDRFADALIAIREELREIENGKADKERNVLKNAPHTAKMIASDHWDYPYSREKAVYPLNYLKDNKFWPHVSRINNPFGDRNLVCVCPPIEDYIEQN